MRKKRNANRRMINSVYELIQFYKENFEKLVSTMNDIDDQINYDLINENDIVIIDRLNELKKQMEETIENL